MATYTVNECRVDNPDSSRNPGKERMVPKKYQRTDYISEERDIAFGQVEIDAKRPEPN